MAGVAAMTCPCAQATHHAHPDEKTTPAMVELLGEDKFVWASDFPHLDAEYSVVAELKENIARLLESAQRKILGENAATIYCLPM